MQKSFEKGIQLLPQTNLVDGVNGCLFKRDTCRLLKRQHPKPWRGGWGAPAFTKDNT